MKTTVKTYSPKPGSAAEKLVKKVQASPGGIRSPDLAIACGIDPNHIVPTLKAALEAGLVSSCKVTAPGKPATHEWKPGPGMPRQADRPLNPKSLGRPVLPVRDGKPQEHEQRPAGGGANSSNTGSRREAPSSVARAPAPAVAKATPHPTPARQATGAAGDDDAAMLERIQAMTEPQVIDYLNHLARVWSWGRARTLVSTALNQP